MTVASGARFNSVSMSVAPRMRSSACSRMRQRRPAPAIAAVTKAASTTPGAVKEQEQHLGVERVIPHTVEPRCGVVCERCASRNSRLDIIRHLTRRLKGAAGSAGSRARSRRTWSCVRIVFRLRGALRIEEGMPRGRREDEDIVRRRLWHARPEGTPTA